MLFLRLFLHLWFSICVKGLTTHSLSGPGLSVMNKDWPIDWLRWQSKCQQIGNVVLCYKQVSVLSTKYNKQIISKNFVNASNCMVHLPWHKTANLSSCWSQAMACTSPPTLNNIHKAQITVVWHSATWQWVLILNIIHLPHCCFLAIMHILVSHYDSSNSHLGPASRQANWSV